MANNLSSYSVRLQTWYRRDGRDWVAWTPALKIMTQERTKKRALEGLREAVEGWFESCIERGVLDEALREVGFAKVEQGTAVDSPNVVQLAHEARKQSKHIRFEIGGRRGVDYIVGEIPAYIASRQLGESPRASS